MCGFYGFLSDKGFDAHRLIRSGLQAHRGPDAYTHYHTSISSKRDLHFFHQRLAIVDLSSNGDQPLHFRNLSIVFNGEIYNHEKLRVLLKSQGYTFRSRTDTEVLLKLWHLFGPECLLMLEGMFSFAIYDLTQKCLTLARDRFGIKPLYYSLVGSDIWFSSELRTLTQIINGRKLFLNKPVATSYLSLGYLPEDGNTFISGINHIKPGTLLDLNLQSHHITPCETRYYDPYTYSHQSNLSIKEALFSSIDLHTQADVPVAFSLSGGVDSSAIVSIYRHIYPDRDIATFSYMHHLQEHSESPWVEIVNQAVNAQPHTFTFDNTNFSDLYHQFMVDMDEPVLNSSHFTEYLLYQNVRSAGFKVLIDGHGADEVFAGYHGFPCQVLVDILLSSKPFRSLEYFYNWSLMPSHSLSQAARHYLKALYYVLSNVLSSYTAKIFTHPSQLIKAAKQADIPSALVSELLRSTFLSSCPYQLRSADRSSMASSIENRVPFLTPTVTDTVFSLGTSQLYDISAITKPLLRASVQGIVPDAILSRRDKKGYTSLSPTIFISQDLYDRLYYVSELFGLSSHPLRPNRHIQLCGRTWRFFNLLYWASLLDIS